MTKGTIDILMEIGWIKIRGRSISGLSPWDLNQTLNCVFARNNPY